MSSKPMTRVSAILLAAGESRRMGTLKALLPWQGTTILEYQIQQLGKLHLHDLVAVLGFASERLLPIVQGYPQARIILNRHWQDGKTTSIKLGLAGMAPDFDAVFTLGVDQPMPGDLLHRLLTVHFQQGAIITVPTYQGQRGHPAIFARVLLPELQKIDEETQGLWEVLRRHDKELNRVAVDSALVLLNLNTPDDYQDALKKYAHAASL